MKILNVHVYLDDKDKGIKIRFEALYDEKCEYPESSKPINFMQYMAVFANSKNYQYKENLLEILNHGDLAIQKEAFEPEVLEPVHYIVEEETRINLLALESNQEDHATLNRFAKLNKKKTTYTEYVAIYTLSTIPHIALNFILSCVNSILNAKKYNAIYFNPPIMNDFHPQGSSEKNKPLDNEMGEDHGSEFMVTLIQRLFALPKPDKYNYTMEALQKIGSHYIENRAIQKPLMECMQVENRCELLWKPIIDLIFSPVLNNKIKLANLLNHARDSIHANQKSEFNYMMHSIHLLAKKKLYAPCIGKNAHDGKFYSWSYSEWDFLRNAEFSMRSDGRMSIVNLQDNPVYTKNYAHGCRIEAIFIPEMQWLGKLIGLEFDECNFHQELIFTRDCTKKLLEQGMQCSLSYVNSALHTENHASFFAHMPLREQKTPFKQLTSELTDTILQNEVNVDEQFNHLTSDDMRDAIELAKIDVNDSLKRKIGF